MPKKHLNENNDENECSNSKKKIKKEISEHSNVSESIHCSPTTLKKKDKKCSDYLEDTENNEVAEKKKKKKHSLSNSDNTFNNVSQMEFQNSETVEENRKNESSGIANSNKPKSRKALRKMRFRESLQSKCSSKEKSKEIETSEGCPYTISIAVPASILCETYLLEELRTYVIGQIARAACIYSVDEIIVYDDGWKEKQSVSNHRYNNDTTHDIQEYIDMMKMVLEYQECPQYLRKSLFPMHRYLRSGGVLNTVNAPHHLLFSEWFTYREGVVEKAGKANKALVNVGLQNLVAVDREIEPGVRVTVKFPPEVKRSKSMYGYVVPPDEPRKVAGKYWGYTVRVAKSVSEVLKSDRFEEGYDLVIGTSDKGKDYREASLPNFSHALIVFGGVQGIEAALRSDPSVGTTDLPTMFPHYLNVCPNQTSRTIRTEEAILITLAALNPMMTSHWKPR